MKLTQLSGVILGVLLLQVLMVIAQDDSVNPSREENSGGNVEEHMLNDEQSSPQETATRIAKLPDAETTFPPLVRPSETPEKDEKKTEAVNGAAPTSSENATKAHGDGGGSNNLYQNVALVFCVTSFLYFV